MDKIKTIILLGTIVILSAFVVGCGNQKSDKFTITFDSNGGTKVAKQEIKKNEKVKEPDEPSREGYNFKGWYIDGEKYDFNKKVVKNLKLKAKWSKITEEQVSNDIETLLKPVQNKIEKPVVDNMVKAKKEIKDFDVLEAKPVLQTTAVNGKCNVKWENIDQLEEITRDLKDTQVKLNATITCDKKQDKISVTATIKKSPYTYTSTENGIISIISIDDAKNYTIMSDKTSAKYLKTVNGAQVLKSMHNDDTNYIMWFNDKSTKYIVKEGTR